MLNLPNILTLSRIFVIPVVIALFYWDSPTTRWVMLGLFTVAGITDFFDGYLARRSNQVSAFGRFLDPIADKLLVAALLLMLVGFERMSTWSYLPAVVILTRELLVSGLREFLAQTHVSVPVSTLAKWKTTLQMFTLGFLIVGSDAPSWIPAQAIGEVGLWLAALLTMITGYDYLKEGLGHMLKDDAAATPPHDSGAAE
ncbi:MAG: CDP-diacylglycerol--glycerol-3-phosphate 3-phosphatidyltransferase [Alphaproteobacteria bacterium]|nr:CDP-diacylglycerol--glycerol-3-phosphate 3-phosphatidyltransferase [Alphaproteobacteria bacterium]